MEITQHKTGDLLVITLAGRLDAGWCDPVEKALTASVHDGEHRIHLDMARVDYMSSAGLRVLFSVYKQLLSIKGTFAVRNPSDNVRSVLQMVGIGSLIATGPVEAEEVVPCERSISSAHAEWEVFRLDNAGFQLSVVGQESALFGQVGEPPLTPFDTATFALGLGALGEDFSENQSRLGEFLAVAGAAAFQPTDGSVRPDFVVSEGRLVPKGHLVLGLLGRGEFPLLARFSAKKENRTVRLSELASTALELAGTPAAVVVAVTETAGLVGTGLRRSPASPVGGDRLGFPLIRDWLSYSGERLFRDTTSLIAGVVAQSGTEFQPLLRPHGAVQGHFHAAAFPYRPLQKGPIALTETVQGLFETRSVNAVLHLLDDSREVLGAGESEFFRGALWVGPLSSCSDHSR